MAGIVQPSSARWLSWWLILTTALSRDSKSSSRRTGYHLATCSQNAVSTTRTVMAIIVRRFSFSSSTACTSFGTKWVASLNLMTDCWHSSRMNYTPANMATSFTTTSSRGNRWKYRRRQSAFGRLSIFTKIASSVTRAGLVTSHECRESQRSALSIPGISASGANSFVALASKYKPRKIRLKGVVSFQTIRSRWTKQSKKQSINKCSYRPYYSAQRSSLSFWISRVIRLTWVKSWTSWMIPSQTKPRCSFRWRFKMWIIAGRSSIPRLKCRLLLRKLLEKLRLKGTMNLPEVWLRMIRMTLTKNFNTVCRWTLALVVAMRCKRATNLNSWNPIELISFWVRKWKQIGLLWCSTSHLQVKARDRIDVEYSRW